LKPKRPSAQQRSIRRTPVNAIAGLGKRKQQVRSRFFGLDEHRLAEQADAPAPFASLERADHSRRSQRRAVVEENPWPQPELPLAVLRISLPCDGQPGSNLASLIEANQALKDKVCNAIQRSG
jgi:hypothetical protein